MLMIYACLFTEINDIEVHLSYGWYMCAFTCLGLFINVGFMLAQ
jgi:hypothetical protein